LEKELTKHLLKIQLKARFIKPNTLGGYLNRYPLGVLDSNKQTK